MKCLRHNFLHLKRLQTEKLDNRVHYQIHQLKLICTKCHQSFKVCYHMGAIVTPASKSNSRENYRQLIDRCGHQRDWFDSHRC